MSAATLKHPSTQEAEAEIRAAIDAWSKAMEDRNVDGLVADCAPDILLFDIKPPYQLQGIDAYRKVWEQCLPCFPAKFQSEYRDLKITVDGDVAFVHGLHHIKPIGDPKHPAGLTWVRLTVCYRRIDGKWKSVHEHVSVPFDPRNGQVAFITEP